MKKLLSIVLCNNAGENLTLPDEGAEILRLGEADTEQNGKALYELIKQAKGKYVVIIDTDCTLNEEDFANFLTTCDGCTADILSFDGGYALKAATLKGVSAKLYNDRFGAEIYTAFNSKEIVWVTLKPFTFTVQRAKYSLTDQAMLEETLEEFARSKAKLTKAVYTFIFDILCARLITFYICAMTATYRKETAVDLSEFDKKLKSNIVLYLALEQRFPADLKKIREKDFKIGLITYNKFKKLIK
ncbi:MAG: glycosyltransferase family 2 protein [Clostridia bacterium]|nr:glycosyltransferase family 2 protein [Clostridia bacterium]